ncbi:hypothetical protein [Gallibacterium sp. ZY190522]
MNATTVKNLFNLSNSAVKLCPSGRRYKAQANLAFVVVDVGEKSITI